MEKWLRWIDSGGGGRDNSSEQQQQLRGKKCERNFYRKHSPSCRLHGINTNYYFILFLFLCRCVDCVGCFSSLLYPTHTWVCVPCHYCSWNLSFTRFIFLLFLFVVLLLADGFLCALVVVVVVVDAKVCNINNAYRDSIRFPPLLYNKSSFLLSTSVHSLCGPRCIEKEEKTSHFHSFQVDFESEIVQNTSSQECACVWSKGIYKSAKNAIAIDRNGIPQTLWPMPSFLMNK